MKSIIKKPQSVVWSVRREEGKEEGRQERKEQKLNLPCKVRKRNNRKKKNRGKSYTVLTVPTGLFVGAHFQICNVCNLRKEGE